MPQRDQRPYRDLGQAIAEARNQAGYSQRELARLASISEGYLPRIEGGRVRPDPTILRQIARLTPISYQRLAELAGYVLPGSGAPDDEADRRFRELPRQMKELALRLLEQVVEYVPEDDRQASDQQTAQERREHEQHG